jgi:hypothetical protein
MATLAPLGTDIAEAIYDSHEDVKDTIQVHTSYNRHSITVQSLSDSRGFYMCSKSGNYSNKR